MSLLYTKSPLQGLDRELTPYRPLKFFCNLLEEGIHADDSRTFKKLKDAMGSELGHLHLQIPLKIQRQAV